jgi:hypothetical protein
MVMHSTLCCVGLIAAVLLTQVTHAVASSSTAASATTAWSSHPTTLTANAATTTTAAHPVVTHAPTELAVANGDKTGSTPAPTSASGGEDGTANDIQSTTMRILWATVSVMPMVLATTVVGAVFALYRRRRAARKAPHRLPPPSDARPSWTERERTSYRLHSSHRRAVHPASRETSALSSDGTLAADHDEVLLHTRPDGALCIGGPRATAWIKPAHLQVRPSEALLRALNSTENRDAPASFRPPPRPAAMLASSSSITVRL